MAENLNYKTEGSVCYEKDPANCKKYGRLYSWESAKQACPDGWLLPSKKNFDAVLEAAGDNGEERSDNLRAPSWADGLNKYGFSALPAGSYISKRKKFLSFGDGAIFWSSMERSDHEAFRLTISDSNAFVNVSNKQVGFSVRCIKD